MYKALASVDSETDFRLTLSPTSRKPSFFETASAQLTTQSWEEKHEDVMMQLFHRCVASANSHERRGEACRALKFVHLPLILGTVIMGSMTQFLFVEGAVRAPSSVRGSKSLAAPEPATALFMWAFLALGIVMGILHLLDPAGRSERHLNFAHRFSDLASDISQTLSQPVHTRPLVEVTLLKAKSGYENLVRTAPGSLVGRFHLSPLYKTSPVNYLAR